MDCLTMGADFDPLVCAVSIHLLDSVSVLLQGRNGTVGYFFVDGASAGIEAHVADRVGGIIGRRDDTIFDGEARYESAAFCPCVAGTTAAARRNATNEGEAEPAPPY